MPVTIDKLLGRPLLHNHKLSQLSDVDLTGIAENKILKVNSDGDFVIADDNNTTDHTALSNIGTNTHAQIDTHIADTTIHSDITTIVFVIDGGGSAITTGIKGDLVIERDLSPVSWTILEGSGTSGSVVIDVWKDTYANFPPTVADTITGTEKPTLSSAVKGQDTDLTTWSDIDAGDILRFNVDSVTDVKKITLVIKCELI